MLGPSLIFKFFRRQGRPQRHLFLPSLTNAKVVAGFPHVTKTFVVEFRHLPTDETFPEHRK